MGGAGWIPAQPVLYWRGMKKAPKFNRSLFALGFLGAYSLAALLLMLMLKQVEAQRASDSNGATVRMTGSFDSDGDFAGGGDKSRRRRLVGDFLGRLEADRADKDDGSDDDATSALGGPSSGRFFRRQWLFRRGGAFHSGIFSVRREWAGRREFRTVHNRW